MTRIRYTKPSIGEHEIAYANDAVTNGWGERCYEYIDRFEAGFRAFVGSRYAIATSSCTGAMHMGLSALGVGAGDEVILADTNWIATAAPITYVGARPVLVDILPDSWCIDPEKARAAITPRTKAIIATHVYGNLCDMDRLLEIGAEHGIPVIEDAAEAIGSGWSGRRAGSRGVFGTFSFHGTKTITTGEGGMFVTDDETIFERVLTLSNHGRRRGQTRQFWPDEIGFKYKMSNVEAAIGCAQLERIDELLRSKRRVFETYAHAFSGLPLSMNPEPAGTLNGYWMPTIVWTERAGIKREDMMQAFKAAQIDARVFFWPLSATGLFEVRHATPQAHGICDRAFNLPSYYEMSDSDLGEVCTAVTDLFKTHTGIR